MPLIEHSFDRLYVIGSFEYPCILHIILVSTCVSIHVFTSDASLLQSPINMICSPDVSILRSLY